MSPSERLYHWPLTDTTEPVQSTSEYGLPSREVAIKSYANFLADEITKARQHANAALDKLVGVSRAGAHSVSETVAHVRSLHDDGDPGGAVAAGGGVIVGDLFSGIGGFSLAAEWMWGPGSTAWFSEIDPFACKVLAHHWPDVPNLGDITRIDWTNVPRVDVLTAGFPCQPHSLAGKRLASLDERDLFSEIIRAADVLRPRFLVLENVPGLFTSDDGRFFGRVLGALAALGYDAEWRVLSAADIGAPHKRERVWIVAYADGGRQQERAELHREPQDHPADGNTCRPHADRRGDAGHAQTMADTKGIGSRARLRSSDTRRGGRRFTSDGGSSGHMEDTNRRRFGRHDQHDDAEPRNVGTPGPADARRWWAIEPDVGRVAHGVPARVDRLRCLGNSIVPQCAYEIFSSIEARCGAVAA